MIIKRCLYNKIDKYLNKYSVLVITGPRQVGKTTLVKEYIKNTNLKSKYITGDDINICDVFSSRNLNLIKSFVEGYEIIVIDEAQRIKDIGLNIKLAVDNIENVKFILTGSSSFDISNQVDEPLVGRKKTLHLFPFSISEIKQIYNEFEIKQKLDDFLIFGFYPRVFIEEKKEDKIDVLTEIVGSYLLKDVLMFDGIKKSSLIVKILRLLAFQIGNPVSFNEIANNCNIDVKTVQRYIDLLEKNFIIYELSAFSKNLRKEISKKKKYYFYDNGVVNYLISNFNRLELRDDIGRLWENFVFMERLKRNSYKKEYLNYYFWRTLDGKEIDFVEERDGVLYGYEFKYSVDKIKKIKEWGNIYNSNIKIINKNNFFEFVK